MEKSKSNGAGDGNGWRVLGTMGGRWAGAIGKTVSASAGFSGTLIGIVASASRAFSNICLRTGCTSRQYSS